MSNKAFTIGEKELHDSAKQRILEQGDWFTQAITTQCKMMADLERHDVVLEKHVEQALDVILGSNGRGSIRRDATLSLSGLVAGVGGSGMIAWLTAENVSTTVALISAVFLTIGILVILILAVPKISRLMGASE